MRKYIVYIFILVSLIVFSQETTFKRTVSVSYKFNKNSIIYDKETESIIALEDLKKLLKKYPNALIKPKDEDADGKPLTYYFIKDSNKINETIKTFEINRNNVFGKNFNLQRVKSKYTLVILQLDLEPSLINVNNIFEAEEAAVSRSYTSVILTETEAEQAKNFAKQQGFKSVIIPNARTVIKQINSKLYPLYIILDKNKSIVTILKYCEEVEDQLAEFD